MINRLLYFFAIITMMSLTQCISPKKHLSNDKYKEKTLLYKQKIKGNKKFSSYTLEEYYSQQTNRQILFPKVMPYLRAYLRGEKHYKKEQEIKEKKEIDSLYSNLYLYTKNDTTLSAKKRVKKLNKVLKKKNKKLAKQQLKIEEGNWMMRVVGEAPAFYDSSVVATTTEQLKLYYQSKGYFHVDISPQTKIKKRKANITYQITENTPFLFSEHLIDAEDSAIKKLIKKDHINSLIKIGQNYDAELLTKERERVTTMLKDKGYYKFTRNFVYFEVDTSQTPYGASVKTYISNDNGKQHNKYIVTAVNFIIDRKHIETDLDTTYNSIHYTHESSEKFSYKILDYHTKVHSGLHYNFTNTLNTQNSLGDLKVFKFININYKETSDSTLECRISANKFPKWSLSNETGVNINVNEGQSIPGPFVNVKLVNKKLTKGFERLELSGQYGIQGSYSFTNQDKINRVREVGGKASLIFPTFLFQDILFSKKFRIKLSNWSPSTTFSAGIFNTNRVEYTRTTFNLTGQYKWTKNKNTQNSLSFADINIINTTNLTSDFENYLDQISLNNGINLKQSFIPSFVSSIHNTYIFNNNDLTKNRKAYFFKIFTESGGSINTISQLISGNNTTEPKLLNLPHYQFLKVNTDFRFYQPVSKTTTLTFRLNTGLAHGFGPWKVLPYDKYFFIGGINSIRAWAPRRLGPGSYKQTDANGDLTYRFEQPGEILLESSVEWRQKIIGFVNWAFFVDAGNTWTLNEDKNRAGAQFEIDNFYREIALGTGTGLRLDFSFLIFRFDVGFKVWDPSRQIVVPFSDKNQRAYNFGIGYPF